MTITIYETRFRLKEIWDNAKKIGVRPTVKLVDDNSEKESTLTLTMLFDEYIRLRQFETNNSKTHE
jgi:hypothetical protein